MERPDGVPKEPARLAGWTTHDLHRVGDHAAEQMPVPDGRRHHVVDDGGGQGGEGVDQRVGRLGQIDGDVPGDRSRPATSRACWGVMGKDRIDDLVREPRRLPESRRRREGGRDDQGEYPDAPLHGSEVSHRRRLVRHRLRERETTTGRSPARTEGVLVPIAMALGRLRV